jgi:hypothetical protein
MSALYRSKVMHRRNGPKAYRFVYRVDSLLLDIDRLDELQRDLRLFSRNRFNLFGFRDTDHGPADGTSLRTWAETLLAAGNVDLAGGRIELLCFPRVLGYVFNPLSLWFCHHRDGSLRAVIYEVRNTFGEKHHYLVSEPDGSPVRERTFYSVAKQFHVSPFLGMAMEYRFMVETPGEQLRVLIDEYADGEKILVATLSGTRAALTDTALLRSFLSMPLMTVKIVAMIHWHALKLWLRGLRFYRKPDPPEHEVSQACRTNSH